MNPSASNAGPLTGRAIGHGEYLIGDRLGQGGFATVYRAFSRTRGSDVAIKVLHPRWAADPGLVDNLFREFRTIARLPAHPNLVRVYDFGEETQVAAGRVETHVYLAMALVTGGSLKDRLEERERLGLDETARLIAQIASVLGMAHRNRLAHRDVKPANVLLDANGWPYLSDFGIAQPADVRGAVHGTPAYMAPEIWRGESAADTYRKADQYALGITAFELLAGRRPFEGSDAASLRRSHLEDTPPSLTSLDPSIPPEVDAVVQRALRKDPAERFETIDAFGAALAGAVEKTRGARRQTRQLLGAGLPFLAVGVALWALAPILLALVPRGLVVAGVPLAEPLATLLAAVAAGLILASGPPLLALARRGMARALGASGAATALVASAEAALRQAYLLVAFAVVAPPLFSLATRLLDPPVVPYVPVLAGLILLAAAWRAVRDLDRSGGPLVVSLALTVLWLELTAILGISEGESTSLGGTSVLVPLLLLAVLAGLLGLHRLVSRRLAADQTARSRRGRLAGAIADLAFVLVGDAGLVFFVTPGVADQAPALPGLATGVVFGLWLAAAVRLGLLADAAGLGLGLLLGAPLLLNLPLVDRALLGSYAAPAGAVWLLAVLVATLLVVRATRPAPARPAGAARRTSLAAARVLSLVPIGVLAAVLVLDARHAFGAPQAVAAAPLAPAPVAPLVRPDPAAPVVVVRAEDLRPGVPGPGETTYDLTLGCSDGRLLGEFHEAFPTTASSAPSSLASGPLASGVIPCSAWQEVYVARRQAAGLPSQPSYSWGWVDDRMAVNADGSVDVLMTQQALFTFGPQSSVRWPTGLALTTSLGDVALLADGQPVPPGSAAATPPYARAQVENGEPVLGWWFPSLASPAQHTYTARFHLGPQVSEVAGATRLAIPVLGADHAAPVWRATVRVWLAPELVPGVTPDIALLADHAVGSATSVEQRDAVTGRAAGFDPADVGAGTGLQVQIGFPRDVPVPTPPSPTPTPSPSPSPSPTRARPTSTPARPTATATPRPPTEASSSTPTSRPVTSTATPAPPTAVAAATAVPPPPPPPPPTATPRPKPSPTRRPSPTATVPPTATATVPPTPSSTPVPPTPTPVPQQNNSGSSGGTSKPPPPPPPPPPGGGSCLKC